MNRRLIARVLLALSLAYWLLAIGAVVANIFFVPSFKEAADHGFLALGCYVTDAMLIYVKCVGFTGASFAQFVLSLPWSLFQIVLFVFSPYFFIGIPSALILWAPLIYPFLYRRHRGIAT